MPAHGRPGRDIALSYERYNRQLALPEIGKAGQKRLSGSIILIMGLGGLGTHSADLLARAGVGRLVLVDGQVVERSNLHRQVMYTEDDLGQPKAALAAERLSRANPSIEIIALIEEADKDAINALLRGVDVLVDGTDNMRTRSIINKACIRSGVPWVFGGVEGTRGMCMTIVPGKTPCLACVFPQCQKKAESLKRSNAVKPILNTVPAVIGALQATEALKLLLGAPLLQGLFTIDVWSGCSKVLDIPLKKGCPVCKIRY